MQRPTAHRLQDKVALVTGAGTSPPPTGTGEAIAVLFARHGARVLLADRDLQQAEKTLATIREEGGQAAVCQADVSCEDDCQAMVQACVERYGALHILVNNAATTGGGPVTQLDAEVWDRTLDINLKSMALSGKYAVPQIAAAGGGAIVNIASIDGLRAGMSQNIPYAVSKGGVATLTQHMAVHHGRQQIRVNCIAPGHIYGPFVRNLPDELRQRRRAIAPLGTEGNAWDVAQAALFLASDEARWISGVVLPVDAGLLAATPLAVFDNLSS